MESQTSRRDFIKGAAAVSAGMLGAGILCGSAFAADGGSASAQSASSGASESGAGSSKAGSVTGSATSASGSGSGSGAAGGQQQPTPSGDPSIVGTIESGGSRVKGYCGPGDWLGEPPQIPDDQITDTQEFDIVIIGSGHSGVGAVMGAVDAGMKVAVIERQAWDSFINKSDTPGVMIGWYGEDVGHVNSQFLIDRGFGPFNTGEICAEFCKRAAGRCNPDIVREYVQNSGAMFDRYHEIYDSYADARKQDDSAVYVANPIDGSDAGEFDMSDMFQYPLCNTQRAHEDVTYPMEGGGYKTWPCNAQFYGMEGGDIRFVHKYIVRYAQENGATYFFETSADVLTQADDGTVTGVIAHDANGSYTRFNADKGVLLCCGDFVGNPAMNWALCNEGMEWGERQGYSADDWTYADARIGDGHKMGCWAGGMIEPTPRGWMDLGNHAGGPWGITPLLMINADGKRFFNEAATPQGIQAKLRTTEGTAAWVTDANWQKTVGNAPLDHGAPNFGEEDFWTDLVASMDACVVGPDPNEVVGAYVAERKFMYTDVYAADTLDDLADYLGYEGDAKQAFLDSIEHYNELCNSDDGDTDYGKDKQYMIPVDTPPFYGGTNELSHMSRAQMVTLSGLMADANLNVIDHFWKPIPHLYAAGNDLGGRYGLGYTTPYAGNSIGMAMTHGWLAARHCAGVI